MADEAPSETPAESTAAPEAPAEAPPSEPAAESAPTPEQAPSQTTQDAPPPSEPSADASAGIKKDSAVNFSKQDSKDSKPEQVTRTSISDVSRQDGSKQSGTLRGSDHRSSKDLARRSKPSQFSTVSLKRGSITSYQERAKIPRYMNSYKLTSDKPFNADKVHAILVQVLKESFNDTMVYDPEFMPTKAKSVSLVIRARVKDQDYDRYKLICLVTIGEKKSCDIFSGVRFLWDPERDAYATHTHENMYMYVIASVFGLYYD